MSRWSYIIRSFMIIVLFAILLAPLLQDRYSYARLKYLSGSIHYPKDTSFTFPGWFDGSYQAKKEVYLNDMFGLRNFFVRLNNQIGFHCFRIAKANGVIIGKDNVLYEEKYITSYMGKDLITEDKLNAKISRLKFLSDTLAKMNKQLILVFAVGKASYYPEYIPDKYQRIHEHNNYQLLSAEAKKAGLTVLDMNAWFLSRKGHSEYPLYAKYGIHGSKYGNILLADSIIKTIEHLRKADLPDVSYTGLKMGAPEGLDYDIAEGLNLLFSLKSEEMADLHMRVEKDTGKTRPDVLVISDSFYWGLYHEGIYKCFNEHHFWFYNQQAYPQSAKTETRVKELNLKAELNKHDVIILMATEVNLAHFGWGFVESAETLFKKGVLKESNYYKKAAAEIRDKIRRDPVWLTETMRKAKRNGLRLEEQMDEEAKWLIEREGAD